MDRSASRRRLIALRALRGRQRLAGLSPVRAGIARQRLTTALLVASSFMIGASIQGYLAYRDRGQCHPNVVSEKGPAHRGQEQALSGRMSGCGCCQDSWGVAHVSLPKRKGRSKR